MRFCLTNPQATGSEAIVLVVGTPAITLSHDAKENPAKSKEVSKSGVGRGSGSANIGEVWTLRPSAFFFQLHTTLPKADYKDPSHPHHTECYMRFFNESIYYSCNYALLFVPAQTFFILPCTCTTRNVPPQKKMTKALSCLHRNPPSPTIACTTTKWFIKWMKCSCESNAHYAFAMYSSPI